MAINVNSCASAINNIKDKINDCFMECELKNSTYQENAKTLNELRYKISNIPSGSGGGSSSSSYLSGLDVFDDNGNYSSVTVNFGSFGTSWRGVFIDSATNMGWISINKMTSTHCVISALSIYAFENDTGLVTDVLEHGSWRFRYTISGTSITFTYDNVVPTFVDSMNWLGRASRLFAQVNSNIDWEYQAPETGVPYKLERICVY